MEMDERTPTERDRDDSNEPNNERNEESVNDMTAQPTEPAGPVHDEATGAETKGDAPSDGVGAGEPGEGEKTESAAKTEDRPRRRGFAAMDRDRVREIASRGGRAAHAAGTAHQFSSDEARVAGKKGGEAPHVRRGGVRRRTPNDPAPTGQGQNHNDRR